MTARNVIAREGRSPEQMRIYETVNKAEGRVYWVRAASEAEALAKLGGTRGEWGAVIPLATEKSWRE